MDAEKPQDPEAEEAPRHCHGCGYSGDEVAGGLCDHCDALADWKGTGGY